MYEARRTFVDLDDSNNNASKKTGGTKQPRDTYNTKRDDDDENDDDDDVENSSSSSYDYYYWASNITDVPENKTKLENHARIVQRRQKYTLGSDDTTKVFTRFKQSRRRIRFGYRRHRHAARDEFKRRIRTRSRASVTR